MEKKINIAEILKDCPTGMELDCTIFDTKVIYQGLNKRIPTHPIVVQTEHGFEFELTQYGQTHNIVGSKCIIFPKGKTTWEGFVPPCLFKDGDVVATTNGGWIGIAKGGKNNDFIPTYCIINSDDKFEAYLDRKEEWAFSRLATEEEKAKLFQAIEDNGYKWNAETKALEKIPKIQDGDIIYTKTSLSEWVSIFEKFDYDVCKCYIDYCIDSDTYCGKIGSKKNPLCDIDEIVEQRLATEEEKQKLFQAIKDNGYEWNPETKTLEKLLKFKVGDKITKIDGSRKGEIFYIDVDRYHVAVSNNIGIDVFFEDQDEWKLIPDIKPKFKVGDKIKKKGIDDVYAVEIAAVGQIIYTVKNGGFRYIKSVDKDYELVSNKFDITTLKPFDKVLVRDTNGQVWTADLFSHIIDINPNLRTTFVCAGHYPNQCIPYEGNEHLLGKNDDCDKYFKIWEN